MGGKLFGLGRMPRARYLEVEGEARRLLDGVLGPEAYRVPRYYGDKPDFGDMDVVVNVDALPASWDATRERIAAALEIEGQLSVGPLWSTVFRGLQVDYFPRPGAVFLSTWQFLCFNDVGNLLGKMFRRLGMKYGEDGLSWVHRGVRQNHKREVLLTRDARRAFSFLGLDPAIWERGFADLEAMFRWVVSSPYFSVEPYVERSAATERLLRERRTMREFVAFLERERIATTYAYASPEAYRPLVAAAFPEAGLERAIEAERAREARELAILAKLNGAVVMAVLPELTGKRLGEFMRRLREHRPDLDQVLPNMTDAEVRELILDFHRRDVRPS